MSAIATRKVLVQSFRFVARNIDHVARAALVPVVLYAVLGTIMDHLSGDRENEPPIEFHILSSVAWIPLELLFVPFYVGWHRMTLLAGATVGLRRFVDVGSRDLRYSGYWIIILLPLIALGVLMVMIERSMAGTELAISAVAVSAMCLAVFTWLSVRLVFVLVETAIDQRTSLKTGWAAGLRHGWNLLLLFACINGAAFLVSGLVPVFLYSSFSDADPTLWINGASNLFEAVLLAIFGAVWVSAMSYAYRDATGYVPPDLETLF